MDREKMFYTYDSEITTNGEFCRTYFKSTYESVYCIRAKADSNPITYEFWACSKSGIPLSKRQMPKEEQFNEKVLPIFDKNVNRLPIRI